ncbi:MAG: elongation factor G, partial [Acidimicrobiales bacterium]|nr:elongation factor G [Acidimicrobiales bacterium]
MNQVAPEKIRNVALVGHGGTGKTTLAEALLFASGAISRIGRVEDGTTVLDFDPEEQKRHQSLSLALAPLEWKGFKINMIDTPGYADFESEVAAALRVADLAVFVVSAVEGIEVQHERLWSHAVQLGVPRMVFVNKLDRDNASFQRTLEQLREVFGAGIAPLELPIGEESAFTGVADLLTDKAFIYRDGKASEGPIPDDMEALEHEVHDNLVEGIVVADDALLERYLDGDIPSFEELEHALASGVDNAQVFPVLCGSATALIGVDRLADFMCEIGPSPLDRPPIEVKAGDETAEVKPDPSGDPLAFVFKTIADPYVGQISLFKVLSGTIRSDDHLVNSRNGSDERLHGLFTMRGREQLAVPAVPAGDIAAVAKLSKTATGDTLAPKGKPVIVPPIEIPEPVLAVAVVARTQADEDKLANALHRLQEEDPALVVERNDETKQTLLKGMGDAHLQITLEKLERKFGVAVDTEEVKVPYRETITGTAEAEGKYKKQSGGHGQFGVCNLRIEPLERGAGFEFIDQIVGGAIPRQFIPAVQKGIEETMAEGGVYGFPVVDVRVTLFDGKFHSVDSSEMSFKMAGRLGFRAAMEKANPVILEPISLIEVTVPSDLQGDVMGDLNSRRARVQGSELTGPGWQTIVATVPTSEIRRYATDLRSITSGRGRFTARHDHYDILPACLLYT